MSRAAVRHRRGPSGGPLCGSKRWTVIARKNEPPTCERCAQREGSSSRTTERAGQANVIGYARVSKADQQLAGQVKLLREAGCGVIYQEHVSGVAEYRPRWDHLLGAVRPGDTVVVVRLDRIGRRMAEVVQCIQLVLDRGAHVRALSQGIDTSAQGGRILIGLFAALAESEREILRERTREGLAAARASGKAVGRPRKITPALVTSARHLISQGYSVPDAARASHVSSATIRRALASASTPDQRQATLF